MGSGGGGRRGLLDGRQRGGLAVTLGGESLVEASAALARSLWSGGGGGCGLGGHPAEKVIETRALRATVPRRVGLVRT